jgi:T-complex protein 1 subunit epsilon
MSLAFDESGRPFIVLREQEKKQRVKGLDAHKVSPPSGRLRPNLESDR